MLVLEELIIDGGVIQLRPLNYIEDVLFLYMRGTNTNNYRTSFRAEPIVLRTAL